MISREALNAKTRLYYFLTIGAVAAEITIIIGIFIAFFALIMHLF